MPIPDTPYTREEMYLNAMATGDASGIPDTPKTREEMYLDAIARNGGGGTSGGGVLVVNFEYDLVSGNVVGDQKASDVFASFTAGTTVLFHVSIEQDDFYYLVIYASNSSGYNFRFYDPSKDATIEAVTGDDGYVEYFNE